jgi:hypothetical protein
MRTKLAVLLLCAGLSAVAQDTTTNPQVRSESPTVVTVRGTSQRVEPTQVRREKREPRGWRSRVGQFTGWALNVDDDIPSARERRARANFYSGAPATTASSAGR